MQFVPIAPPFVVVRHQVMEDCEVVRQTRVVAVVVVLDEEEAVEGVVEDGVLASVIVVGG